MMAPSRSKPKSKISSLKSGRPPTLTSASSPSTASSQSARHTRTLIRQHHTLQKRLSHARSSNDTSLVADLESQLAATGGLKSYQVASTIGQSKTRGGDSSRVLVEWLRDEIQVRRKCHPGPTAPPPLKILEVGALSTTNAVNIANVTRVRRIDLRSSGPGIEEIDFMALPLPSKTTDPHSWDHDIPGYDVLSLSLVLNYVPDAKARGDMLRRTTRFFSSASSNLTTASSASNGDPPKSNPSRHADQASTLEEQDAETQTANDNAGASDRASVIPKLPCLFLVLPGPCVHNSRYLTVEHLTEIMESLGYSLVHDKTTAKLYYSLWRWDERGEAMITRPGGPESGNRPLPSSVFRKREINPGAVRNNFCIVMEGQE